MSNNQIESEMINVDSVTGSDNVQTASVESITSLNFDETDSVKSTGKSVIKKPSGIKPPSTSILSRIGRPCQGHHQPKAGPPPPPPPISTESNNEIATTSASVSASASPSPSIATTMRRQSDEYLRSNLPDHGIVLTDDTDSFIIGQRVWVGGIRPGHIAYIGETHFAPGDWAGVVLDDANGKNDGCVSGKRYFQCEPKRGIFSRLTRLTREQIMNTGSIQSSLHNQQTSHSHSHNNTSDFSMNNQSSRSSIQSSPPPRSGTVSPTNHPPSSVKSYSMGKLQTSSSKNQMAVGDRVIVSSGLGSRPGILQYMGETKFAPGNWCGIQLDEPTGKNDGSVDGFKYFDCPQSYGIFVPLAKVTLSPSSRKTQRLSRSGSKESLASVGTFASVQSTATSRLRMSAQHLSSSTSSSFAKPPITKPKNAFSLQDVLREKQNHIEQLLLEKDLDRQDVEHQSTLHQKTLNQCQERIKQLEQQLDDEKRRADDLQFNIDEVTCGEELSIHLQEYKNRILQLENQLKTMQITAVSDNESKNATSAQQTEQLEKELECVQKDVRDKTNEIIRLKEECESTSLDWQSKLNIANETYANAVNELENKINYYKVQNEQFLVDLQQKDVFIENEYLNMKHIENELREDLIIVTDKLKTLEIENDVKLRENLDSGDLIQKELINSYEKKLKDLMEQNQLNVLEKQNQINSIEKSTTEKINQLREQIELIQLEHQQNLKLTEENYQTQITQQQINFHQKELELNENLQGANKEILTIKNLADKLKMELEILHKENQMLIDQQNINKIEIDQLKLDIQILSEKHEKELIEINCTALEKYQLKENELIIDLRLQNTELIQQNLIETVQMIKNYELKIIELNEENEKKISECIEYNKKELNELETKLETLTSTNVQLQNEITEINAKMIDNERIYEKNLTAIQLENNELKIKIKNLEIDHEKIMSDNQNLQETINNLQKSMANDNSSQSIYLQEMNLKLLQYKEENEKLQMENKRNAEHLNDLKQNFNEQLTEKTNLIQRETMEKNEIIKNSQFELDNLKLKYTENITEIEKKLTESEIKRNELSKAIDKLELTVIKLKMEQREQTETFHKKKSEFNRQIINLNTMAEKSISDQLEISKLNELNLMEAITSIQDESTNKYDELLVHYHNKETLIIELEKQLNTVNDSLKESHQKCIQFEEKLSNQNQTYENMINDLNLKFNKIFMDEKLELELELKLKQEQEQEQEQQQEPNNELNKKFEILIELFSNLKVSNQMLIEKCTEFKGKIENNELEMEKLRNAADDAAAASVNEFNKHQHQKDQEEFNLKQQLQLQLQLENINETKYKNDLEKLQNEILQLKLNNNQLVNDLKNELKLRHEELQMKNENIFNLTKTLNEFKERERELEKLFTERDATNKTTINELANEKSMLNNQFTEKFNQQIELIDKLQIELIDKEKSLKYLNEELQQQQQQQQQQQNETNKTTVDEFNVIKEKLIEMEKEKLQEIELLTIKLKEFEEQQKQKQIVINNQTMAAATEASAATSDKLENIIKLKNNENERLNLTIKQLNTQITELQNNNNNKEKSLELPKVLQATTTTTAPATATAPISNSEQINGKKTEPTTNFNTAEILLPANENENQISFLNSIIADMQMKNVTLLQRIESLEGINPLDFMMNNGGMFQLPSAGRRLPAPRLFCDICDEFDSHDTEDCPLQSSNNSPPYSSAVTTPNVVSKGLPGGSDDINNEKIKERKLPPPRLYCENCETFDDHETQECSITF